MICILRESCWWPGMAGSARKYARGFHKCRCMRKDSVCKVSMGEMPVFKTPFKHVAIDLVGKFKRKKGYTMILTYICLASKYPEVIPLKEDLSEGVAEALLEIFSRNDVPLSILSDQGSQFMGALMKLLCTKSVQLPTTRN